MLNSIIKVDLHIHSKASSYKDGIIVEKSNIDNIDVLVDGKFEISKKSYDAMFRGSKNQRLIDVKASLKNDKVVELKKYDIISHQQKSDKRHHLYI